jgi:chromosome segregation ATPase
MWDLTRQQRLDHLRDAQAAGTLTETEGAELRSLVEERCSSEATALEAATRQAEERDRELAEQLQQVESQNRELQSLIQEQQAYLAEVEATIARMEERRRAWRERYAKVTGKPLDEPVPSEARG